MIVWVHGWLSFKKVQQKWIVCLSTTSFFSLIYFRRDKTGFSVLAKIQGGDIKDRYTDLCFFSNSEISWSHLSELWDRHHLYFVSSVWNMEWRQWLL